ncbi:CARDB domain-containing protein [Halovivax gelatinilyticus]|uniref:CARDB domain-containing protein n=1 Tax=Halovivax gelatinilyticus TaxID=2961597 RepID=UPI0020CA9C21|nr:CARDB domain-containing protein [Halovivax gelatinilyticus]
MRLIAVVLTVVLAGILLVPLGGATAASADSVSDSSDEEGLLSLVADEQEGETIAVTLEADADDVAGYGANVTFDPDILAIDEENVSGVDFGDPVTNIDNRNGWVFVTQSQAVGDANPTLVEFEFTVLASGDSELSFLEDDTTLNDGAVPPEDIDVDLDGTEITVELEDEQPNDDTLSLVAGEQDGTEIGVTLETTVENAAGYQAFVTYDPDVVTVEDVVGIDFDDPVVNVDNDEGTVFFTQSQATGEDRPTFAEIQFSTHDSGETDLAFDADETGVNDESSNVLVEFVGTTLDVEEEADDGGGGLPPPPPEPDPAEFEFEVVDLSSSAVVVGDSIEVTVDVTNVGEQAGNYELTLQADGNSLVTESVLLSGDDSETVSITYTFTEAGAYELFVNDEPVGTVDVSESTSDTDDEADTDDGVGSDDESDGTDPADDGTDASDDGASDGLAGFGVGVALIAFVTMAVFAVRRY